MKPRTLFLAALTALFAIVFFRTVMGIAPPTIWTQSLFALGLVIDCAQRTVQSWKK